jgi:hypothetical protein
LDRKILYFFAAQGARIKGATPDGAALDAWVTGCRRLSGMLSVRGAHKKAPGEPEAWEWIKINYFNVW